jgi:hypothetical protein
MAVVFKAMLLLNVLDAKIWNTSSFLKIHSIKCNYISKENQSDSDEKVKRVCDLNGFI